MENEVTLLNNPENKEIKEITEVQSSIISGKPITNKATQEEFLQVLKTISPGTKLRAAIDGTLKGGKGALIVIENEYLPKLLDGGFKMNARFTPQRLIELSKMDGAIILSKDLKKIIHSNVMLYPDSSISTSETGTRHKSAERTAKQTGALVIAISERKHEITVYFKDKKHKIVSVEEILQKTSEHLQFMEKQRELFDKYLEQLTYLEISNQPSINKAVKVIQKGKFVKKLAMTLKQTSIELGEEGMVVKARLKEITDGVYDATNLTIKDYTKLDLQKSLILLNTLNFEEILEKENILKCLGIEDMKDEPISRGWRILSETALGEEDIEKIIREAKTVGRAINSGYQFHSALIGEEKAKALRTGLQRIKLTIER